MGANKAVEGEYVVKGKNPDGTGYQGKATIRKEGNAYTINWYIAGEEFNDERGYIDGGTLRFDFYPAIYEIKEDGTLEGEWGKGNYEKLTPVRAKPLQMETAGKNYRDFQVLVTSERNVRASSDQGDEHGELQLDKNKIRLTLELIANEKTDTELLKAFGGELYEALFSRKIHGHLRATRADAEAVGEGVRLRLVFEPPELLALPWEFLYDDGTNTFLANDTQTVLSRYVDVPLPKREIKSTRGPLKVLLVIASPTNYAQLDALGEAKLIQEALAQRIAAEQVELDVLHEATVHNISQKLREKPYNVFHFIGHGDFKNNNSVIALVEQDGTGRLLDDGRFANFFLGNRSLGLVVLNSCKGAEVSSSHAFVGLAPNLVRRGLPAVVAMQYSIYDTTAKLFADEFYRTLALGWPVDAALQTTRNAISIEVGLGKRDFATPVLYMRAKDGIVFG